MMRDVMGRSALKTRLGLALCLWFVATGCALCERDTRKQSGGATDELAALVPADVDMALFTMDWRDLRGVFQSMERQLEGKAPMAQVFAEGERRFGVDLRDVPGLKEKGVRVSGGLAVTAQSGGVTLLVPLEAQKVFEKFVTSLCVERFQAAEQPIDLNIGGTTVHMMVKASAGVQDPAGVKIDNLVLAWAVKDGLAIVYPGQEMINNARDPQEAMRAVLEVGADKTLGASKDYQALREPLSSTYKVFGVLNVAREVNRRADELAEYIHSREEAERYRKMAGELGLAGLGVSFDDQQARVHLQMTARGDLKTRAASAAKALADGAPLAGALDGEPVFAARFAIEPSLGLKELRQLLGGEASAMDEVLSDIKKNFSVDVEKDLLPSLDGNLLLTTYDLPLVMLSRPSLSALLTRSETTVAMGVKDRGAMLTALDKVVASAGGFVKREDQGQIAVFIFADKEPMARLAVGPAIAVMASQKIPQDRLLKMASGQGAGPQGALSAAAAKPLLAGQADSGLVLDVAQIKAILSAVQPSAKTLDGLGPIILHATNTELGPVFDLTLAFVKEGSPQGGDPVPTPAQ